MLSLQMMSNISINYIKCDDIFFVNCIFENDIILLFSRIYDVIKIIMMPYFLLITYLKMTYFYYFLRIRNVINNRDDMFFANCIFENDIFMYILQRRLYQSSY